MSKSTSKPNRGPEKAKVATDHLQAARTHVEAAQTALRDYYGQANDSQRTAVGHAQSKLAVVRSALETLAGLDEA